MSETYDHHQIEQKWQDIWEKENAFKADDSRTDKPKFYGLIEFPYPSGQGLHVGHPRSNTALDIIARKRRMQGYNVLYPIGWDAFGLPTENYAIKNNIHPEIVTKKNIDRFREQLKKIGFAFDYSREVNTTDADYYKWTQWIFLQLFKKGLAYKSEVAINWCTSCNVGLANEEVVGGKCERCGGDVVRKTKSQWMLRITDYAQKLLDGLDDVDFIEKVKTQQRNWIGKSTGAQVKFNVPVYGKPLTVFTTRPDTLFGATYMVISPEHPMIDEIKDKIENFAEVDKYREVAKNKSDFERTETAKEKTGVVLGGVYAINPVNGNEIPVWVSDYVLMSYGTGAIMAVPAHDERDWEFAKKFGLPIKEVVGGSPVPVTEAPFTDIATGKIVNSDFLDGLTVKEAKEKIIAFLTEKGIGEAKVNYKLRDWVFSRQRYWGEPIPLIHCDKCGWVPVPEEDLPLRLPHTDDFIPTADAQSPLAKLDSWVNTVCPHCGGKAKRETDTMPQWAGSSWYFIRYTDPHNTSCLADPDKMKYWLPVDWYNGGMEHTTLHLLYSRFWYRVLYDIGVVPTKEPYKKRTSHGMILGENGEKMSKSRDNVINPDEIVDQMGADAFRMYEMFMGAFDQAIPWSTKSAMGCRRFLERVWRVQDMIADVPSDKSREALLHSTIKKVSDDFESMKFNTAIAAMMAYVNEIYKLGNIRRDEFSVLLRLLNPVAPHITEEMWQNANFEGRVYSAPWPECDESKLVKDEVEIVVQICGKIKAKLNIPANLDREGMEKLVEENETVKKLVEGKTVKKIVAVPGKLLNIVAI